jgi:hypothetical protein
MDAQEAAPAVTENSQEQPAADAGVSGTEQQQVVRPSRARRRPKPPDQLLEARIALRRAISELGPNSDAARAKLQALEESFQAYHLSRQHSLLIFCVCAYTLDACLVRTGYANCALRGAQALVRAVTGAGKAAVGLALKPLRLLR